MNTSKLDQILSDEPKYRKDQAQHALFNDLIEDWQNAMGLPKDLRQKLNDQCPLDINAESFVADDELTIKALITLEDQSAIEAVLMKHKDGRNTLCVSCMVGCPMGCTFCATGNMGLTRPLTTEEILVQAFFFARLLKKENKRIDGVVFMGMGEPLRNYPNVMSAVRTLHSKDGFNISARHISISTCGILDGIERLANEDLPLNLAISLHASNDKVRRLLMPISQTHTIDELLETVEKYIAKTNRKVMLEYLMIDDINDRDEHALELAKLITNKLMFVNLIKYNPTGKFTPSESKQMKRFKDILEQKGITVTMRYRFGIDIEGACGQLATKKKK